MVMGTMQRGGSVQQRGGQNRNVQCFYCNKPGHVKRDCYKWQRDNHGGKANVGSGNRGNSGSKNVQFNHVNMQQDVTDDVAQIVGSSRGVNASGSSLGTIQVQPGTTYSLPDGTMI